jgi:hypothetical protein
MSARLSVDENLIKAIVLDNGLELKLFDTSRTVAGDRWRVSLLARIDMPIDDVLVSLIDHHPDDIQAFKDTCGGTVRFEQTRERHFIDGIHKERVFQGMMELYLKGSLAYLSHPIFNHKYVICQY